MHTELMTAAVAGRGSGGLTMGDHLEFNLHMTSHPSDAPIRSTFLGQAHITGTGPEGRTCRECKHWFSLVWKLIGGKRRPCPVPPH